MPGIAYCMHCRSKVGMKDGTIIYYKNGVPAEKGICSKCGCKLLRILNRAERAELKTKQIGEKKDE